VNNRVSESVVRVGALLVMAAACANGALARDAVFVKPEQTAALHILPAPPAVESPPARAELAELHEIQKRRTPHDVMRAVADDTNETVFLFGDVMGSGFNPQALPVMTAFAARVRGDEGPNTEPAKQGFDRTRPYNLDHSLHPVCKTKTVNDSYPSGHATSGYLLALTLIDMVPEMQAAILARADEYAQNRLVCGVHFRSDIQASRLVAYAMHAAMSANADYQRELAAARQELRAAQAPRLAHN
jgi:acid phosphatase (class A)